MKRRKGVVVLVAGSFFWLARFAAAQTPTTGAISGVVKDPSGAVVNGAAITLSSSSGVQRGTSSDAAGHYAFLLLPPGTYRLEASRAGFSQTTLENIPVRITETGNVDLSLQIAVPKVVVEVQAAQEQTPAGERSSSRTRFANCRCRRGIFSNC